jgi:hypothetical protein
LVHTFAKITSDWKDVSWQLTTALSLLRTFAAVLLAHMDFSGQTWAACQPSDVPAGCVAPALPRSSSILARPVQQSAGKTIASLNTCRRRACPSRTLRSHCQGLLLEQDALIAAGTLFVDILRTRSSDSFDSAYHKYVAEGTTLEHESRSTHHITVQYWNTDCALSYCTAWPHAEVNRSRYQA